MFKFISQENQKSLHGTKLWQLGLANQIQSSDLKSDDNIGLQLTSDLDSDDKIRFPLNENFIK